ncbi:uncharacterized protein LOC129944439 [Eupeodes corollae]|uniref:uncharacterized protein LOC129944439 n=1 Tax=Eupeodes corollae TaxID=290404 RepID=UPI002490DA2E|nr:uncharacterized protein LOC129944439 [Eupeodes corollae]
MCEHYQVNHQSTLGCNQSRINENENGIAPNNDGGGDGGGEKSSMEKEKIHSIGAYHHQHQIQNQNQHQERSKDHRKDMEVQESFSCKSLQDTIEILKIKNNPFSRDTQRIIAQLETELSNFQRELQRTSSSSCFLSAPSDGRPYGESTGGGGGGSVQENSKVQSKRGLSLMLDKKQGENPDEQKGNEEEPTLQDFIADKLEVKFSKHCNRPNSSSTRDRATASISKEYQTNLRSPTQMFCHLEKEKLLLIQKFRTSEMQTIQGDLNELHVFIKDQLNGIYRSITRENYQNLKYFSNDQSETWSWSQSRSQSQSRRTAPSDIKNKQKSRQRNFLTLQHDKKQQQPEKIQAKGLSSLPPLALPLSSSPTVSPSLTAPTSSSVLSSSQQMHEGGISLPLLLPTESKKKTTEELRSIWPRHYKKSLSSSSSSPSPDDNGNANNTKSMMKQKQAAAVAAAASSSSSFKLSTASAESEAVTDAKKRHHHHNHRHHNISDVNVRVDKLDKADKAVCGKKSKYSHNLQVYAHHQEHLFANCRDAHCRFRDTPFCSDNHDDGGRKYHFSNVVDCRCQRWRLRGSSPSQPCPQPTQINDKVQRMMGARSTRPSTTTKSDINSTKKTSLLCPCPCSYSCPGQYSGPAVMTHNQRHHCHQHLSTTMTTTTTGIAQDRIQLISSSLPAPTSVETAGAEAAAVMIAAPSYISTRPTDEDSRKTDAVTNAAVRAIIKDAYATTVTTTTDDAAAAIIVATNTATAAKAAGHSNGIREPSHHQTHNSWQRVNLKNPTGCQMKKQICGPDGYECTIKNTNNNNDNRSNYPEIHDCQKCRANSINPFCGGLDLDLGLSLSSDSAKMHVVGAGAGANAAADVDNGATAFGVATACDDFDYKCDDEVDVNDDEDRGNDRDDFGAGGDGPINWKGEHKSLADGKENFTCHPEKRQRQKQNQNQKQRKRQQQWREQTTPRLLHCCVAQSALAFQTDLDDFKEFLDEIILSTPTTD